MDKMKIQELLDFKEKEKLNEIHHHELISALLKNDNDQNDDKLIEDKKSFRQYIENAGFSVRTTNVLLNNVSSIQEIIEIDENRLKSFKNCGEKTIREVFEFQKKLSVEFGYILPKSVQKKEIPDFTLLPDAIKKDVQFYESIKQELSKRAQNVIVKNEIDSLEKFMALTEGMLFQIRNCGRNTVAEIKEFQKKTYELVQKLEKNNFQDIPSTSDLIISDFKKCCEFSIDDDNVVDLNAPFFSLKKWVSEIGRKVLQKSEQAHKAFMLRMGMMGNPPMTLEEIGDELGLTRERIRQIIDKMEKTGKHQIRRKKLQPLIKKTLEIVNSRGGKIKSSTLVSLLLAHGPNGELLKFATPFIDFLGTLQEWKDAGLQIDENGIIISTEKADEITVHLSAVIVTIAKQNADEFITDDLWSIDYGILKKLLLDWYNMKYSNRKISELSNSAVEEALLQCQSQITKEENRVYSYFLWAYRYGSLFKATDAILKKSGKAMHFSDIFNELIKYRTHDDSFTERNIHATLDRNENVFLWDRGTFIHKTCVSIPHDLISDTEKWILKKLREDVPFIAIYGVFEVFEKPCLESNIPSEIALYSILKELSHPLIAYPRIPYIYLNNGKIERIPAILAVEQFLQDAGRPVSYDEIKFFVIDKLLLKELQFNQMIYQIPNTIRTQNKEFLHTDFLNLDDNKFEEIAAYTRKIVNAEEHVSVLKIFKDKKITCKILGIDDPVGLFSLFKVKLEDEFDLQSYPQIRLISADDYSRKRGFTNEVISFIKEKRKVCSYEELQDVFVEKLGYIENTVRYVTYNKSVCKYLKNCYVHKDTIEWNDEKQEQIEKTASDRYNESVKAGRCYGFVKDMIEFDNLPDLREGIYWTPYLLADLLIIRGKFKILGSEKNAFVPIPNQFGIENFEDMVYEILKNEYDGGANLNAFAAYLRKLEIIRKDITQNILGKSEKVKIVGNEIILTELLDNA